MAGENGSWREVLLEDVAEELTVGHVGPMTNEYVESGVPFLRNKNVDPLNIDWDDMRYISREFHEKLKKSALSPGDVVIVRTGTPGAAALIPDTLPEANCSDLVIVRCGPKLDRRFLVYYLNSAAKHHINSHLVGAVQQHFNVGAARKLKMNLPPLSEQKAIAEILGALDAKIELNRRMNLALESLARCLFKSWFVDFDPVRAKMDGREPPGLSPATAALFPDSFEHTRDGELIPKGWRQTSVGDHVELQRGKTYKSKLKGTPGPYLLGLGSIERNGGFRSNKLMTYGGDNPETLLVYPGDLYVSLKDVTQAADLLGAVARVPTAIKVGRMTQDTVKLVFNEDAPSRNIVYRTLLTPEYRAHCRSHATGTTNLGLARDDFLSYPLIVPPPEIEEAFDKFMGSVEGRIDTNANESETLAALRDTLLPRLLSGELRVADAERFTKAVSSQPKMGDN